MSWLVIALRKNAQAIAIRISLLSDLGHKIDFELNVMSTMHLTKLIATFVRENGQRDAINEKLENRIVSLEDRLKEISKQHNADVIV